MAKKSTFKVHQGVDPHYLQSTLTKDITPSEALFDLVDNSIDAARRCLDPSHVDQYGLPLSYEGFVVRLHVGCKRVYLSDNCGGIEDRELAKRVFVTGKLSHQPYGIGGFGIGLKRALFRLGTKYALKSDTDGDTAASISFTRADLAKVSSDLTAHRLPSLGRKRFVIAIARFENGVEHHLTSALDSGDLARNLSRRYGIFISKGLKIVLNGVKVPAFMPALRGDGLVAIQATNMVAENGVSIFVDAGMHSLTRLPGEADYSPMIAKTLTDQYGWYFVCNDRIVRVASHEPELGWTTKWHQEYYGFLGWVRFVAEDPEDLPWDTKKTFIDPNSLSFRAIATRLQEFAEQFKADNKKARIQVRNGDPQPSNAHPAGSEAPGSTKQPPGKPSGAAVQQPRRAGRSGSLGSKGNPASHNENWVTVLPAMGIEPRNAKLAALVYEAINLRVDYPYAGSMLLRSLVECSLFAVLKLEKRLGDITAMYFEQQAAQGRGLTDAQKKAYRPTLSIATTWLTQNREFFPADVRRECSTALTKLVAHLKELNGIVHEADLIDSGKLKIIRNDILPLVRFLLAHESASRSKSQQFK